jgi:hypothetical protein
MVLKCKQVGCSGGVLNSNGDNDWLKTPVSFSLPAWGPPSSYYFQHKATFSPTTLVHSVKKQDSQVSALDEVANMVGIVSESNSSSTPSAVSDSVVPIERHSQPISEKVAVVPIERHSQPTSEKVAVVLIERHSQPTSEKVVGKHGAEEEDDDKEKVKQVRFSCANDNDAVIHEEEEEGEEEEDDDEGEEEEEEEWKEVIRSVQEQVNGGRAMTRSERASLTPLQHPLTAQSESRSEQPANNLSQEFSDMLRSSGDDEGDENHPNRITDEEEEEVVVEEEIDGEDGDDEEVVDGDITIEFAEKLMFAFTSHHVLQESDLKKYREDFHLKPCEASKVWMIAINNNHQDDVDRCQVTANIDQLFHARLKSPLKKHNITSYDPGSFLHDDNMNASNAEGRVSYQFSAVEEFKKSINGSASMKALQTQVVCCFVLSSFIISSSPSSFCSTCRN